MQWGTKSSRVRNVPINLIIQAMNPLTKIIWKSHKFSMYALGQAKIKLKLTEELKREREKSAQKNIMKQYKCNECDFCHSK